MQHFSFLTPEQKTKLFLSEPVSFDYNSSKNLLAASLGATLYIPCTRPELVKDVVKMATRGASSVVLCLEDSVPDNRLEEAELNLVQALQELTNADTPLNLPLIFVRVRNPEHLKKVFEQNLMNLKHLTGFVFPKFENTQNQAYEFVEILKDINIYLNDKAHILRNLYFMPVLESPNIAYRESRKIVLAGIKSVLDQNRDLALAVRIGATDISSVYGLRRSRDFTVYDIHVVASTIADIINVFGRANDEYVITGAVWEHFESGERFFKPQLRESLFGQDKELRRELLTKNYDSFIREIQLDRANGLTGKTVIHPSHLSLVHSLAVVTAEEYSDALDITNSENSSGGAQASLYRNKMNEIKPHLGWAEKTLLRAQAFGVANEGIDFVDFLEASQTE